MVRYAVRKIATYSFVFASQDLLNGCKVWWEVGQDITTPLIESANPNRPCTTRVHPYYLDLGMKFFISGLMKEIMVYYNVA